MLDCPSLYLPWNLFISRDCITICNIWDCYRSVHLFQFLPTSSLLFQESSFWNHFFFFYFFNFIFLLNFLIQCNIIMFFHFPTFSHILPTFLPTQIYILFSKQQQTNKKKPRNKIKNKQTIKKIKANRKRPVRQDEMSKQSKMK